VVKFGTIQASLSVYILCIATSTANNNMTSRWWGVALLKTVLRGKDQTRKINVNVIGLCVVILNSGLIVTAKQSEFEFRLQCSISKITPMFRFTFDADYSCTCCLFSSLLSSKPPVLLPLHQIDIAWLSVCVCMYVLLILLLLLLFLLSSRT
jgi:hypothetical protein